jgi:hypothetical protein
MKKFGEIIESYLVCSNRERSKKYENYLRSKFIDIKDDKKSAIYNSIINLYDQKKWELSIEKKTFLEKSLLPQEEMLVIGDININIDIDIDNE